MLRQYIDLKIYILKKYLGPIENNKTLTFHRVVLIQAKFLQILESERFFGDTIDLTADLLHQAKPTRCYTLITDSMYEIILQLKLFDALDQFSYVLIKIQDYEDLLEPDPDILKSLLEARKSGCQTYLIYLANGIQTERFLRFIDKLVMLSKYVNHIT